MPANDHGLRIRNVDLSLWREFRAIAIRRKERVGDLLTRVLREWIEREKGKGE